MQVMKTIIDQNFKELDKVQTRLKSIQALNDECIVNLNNTFFSKDWKGLFNPILIISICFEIYLRGTISYDVSTIWNLLNIVFAFVHFVGIFATTLIYFRWLYLQRKLRIINCEIELRFQYIKTLLAIYEKQIQSIKNEQN